MLKRLQMTCSFQKWQNQNQGMHSSGIMTILVGGGFDVPMWGHWALMG